MADISQAVLSLGPSVNGVVLSGIAAFISLLLAIIAIFLRRLLKQFDELTDKVAGLNATLMRIDRDLSGDLKVVVEKSNHIEKRVNELDTLWDRLRLVENRLVVLESTRPPPFCPPIQQL